MGRGFWEGLEEGRVLACAKFSKSTLKYILRCKLRRPENWKRGGNKSPPSRNHGSITEAPIVLYGPLKAWEVTIKRGTASKVFLRSAPQKQFSSAVIYEYFLACGRYFSFFFYMLIISNFLCGKKKGRFFLY